MCFLTMGTYASTMWLAVSVANLKISSLSLRGGGAWVGVGGRGLPAVTT